MAVIFTCLAAEPLLGPFAVVVGIDPCIYPSAALINFPMIFCRNELCVSHDGTREVSGGVFNDNEVQDHFVSAFALKEEPDAAFKMESLGVSPA